MMNPFEDPEEIRTLALAIVNTIPEPFIVLDEKLRVLAASRSFYETFKADPEQTRGRSLYALGDGEWDIPALRLLLDRIIPRHAAMENFEVSHDFRSIGPRVMLLNARQIVYEKSGKKTILLAFRDVTALRETEAEKHDILAKTESMLIEQRVLLRELRHRIGNSLQLIASILMLKSRSVNSEETRAHLEDAYQRVLSVAAVQSHLHAADSIDQVEVESYLTKLCRKLSDSMIPEERQVSIDVLADDGMVTADYAVNIGLIVTELVTNAIRYAFPSPRTGAAITVLYEMDDLAWRLTVSDNGAGKVNSGFDEAGRGLGTTIIRSLVKQLGAGFHETSTLSGYTVAISSPTFTERLPRAA